MIRDRSRASSVSVLALILVASVVPIGAQDSTEKPAVAPSSPQTTPAPSPPSPGRQASPNATLISPEVLEDRRVAFRIWAPKASDVIVGGDWQEAPGPVRLEKDEQGVWSVVVGPLSPDVYSYTFSVDGVRTIDPKNATIKQGIGSLDSLFFVNGPEAAFLDNATVPHGVVRQVWYSSSTLGAQRRMHVYTPPGYDASADRYPVLYLLHGGGDEDSGWSTVGRAGFILDNLIASGKALPMLVVMPNGSLPRQSSPSGPPNVDPRSPEGRAAREAAQNRFTSELLDDIVPLVEKSFRVASGTEKRALAGLSMGGGQTLRVLTSHPDRFGCFAIWSAGLFGSSPERWEESNEAFLAAAESHNASIRLLSIVVGEKDFALPGSKSLAGVLEKRGVRHELRITGGGHTWINWRRYLDELAPRLFR
jgi:enterochelin esterase-like enzyme